MEPTADPSQAPPAGPASGHPFTRPQGIRWRSKRSIFGMPLFDVALGPDPSRGEFRGHAKGFFAVGDIATGVVAAGGLAKGWIAFGGLAAGVVAVGGLAGGVFAFGGLAIGLIAIAGLALGGLACGGVALGLAAFGGVAIGGLAAGGIALGYCAIGDVAIGYYAMGRITVGAHVWSSALQDPEAGKFFGPISEKLPWLREMFTKPL